MGECGALSSWGSSLLTVTVEQLGTVFANRNAPSIFLQPVLNVSRVWPRDLEPLGGDIDCAKDATLREKQKHVPTVHPVTQGSFPQTHEERAVAFLRQPCCFYK